MTARQDLLTALEQLRFYVTPAHACSYLPNKNAVTLFVDPQAKMTQHTYSMLVTLGFRRSGPHIYRPHCPSCRECVPVRIAVDAFKPNRSQRRIQKQNTDLVPLWQPAEFNQEHFDLYKRYLAARHPGSSMITDDPEQYQRMLLTDWGNARLLELRVRNHLCAVAMTDWLNDGLSAVYTFYAPELQQRSLGIYAILQQIATTQEHQLPYLYLGYWIEPCANMSYKKNFSALEIFDGQNWLPINQKQ